MAIVTINLNVDGTALSTLLEKFTVTIDEVLAAANKLQTDVQTLIGADKDKIAANADLTAKLAAAVAANVDQAKVDLLGQTIATTDALTQPTP